MSELAHNLSAAALHLARMGIEAGLEQLDPDAAVVEAAIAPGPRSLREPGSAFVTLRIHDRLRGCIGSLEARRPLGLDIASNGARAAYADPRFPALTHEETRHLHFDVAVLGTPSAIKFDSEAALFDTVRPGVDGIIVAFKNYRATFLPSVWHSLDTPSRFFAELRKKAGIPDAIPMPALTVSRYQVTEYGPCSWS